jgi:hypothetical protein
MRILKSDLLITVSCINNAFANKHTKIELNERNGVVNIDLYVREQHVKQCFAGTKKDCNTFLNGMLLFNSINRY